LAYAQSDAALADPDLREQLRNSVIQCFEFTYELSWKMLKHHLETTEPSPDPAVLDWLNRQEPGPACGNPSMPRPTCAP
jgi:hypothetical protein